MRQQKKAGNLRKVSDLCSQTVLELVPGHELRNSDTHFKDFPSMARCRLLLSARDRGWGKWSLIYQNFLQWWIPFTKMQLDPPIIVTICSWPSLYAFSGPLLIGHRHVFGAGVVVLHVRQPLQGQLEPRPVATGTSERAQARERVTCCLQTGWPNS